MKIIWLLIIFMLVPGPSMAGMGDRFNPYIIYQILPDEPSNIERGFENYFSIRGIAVKIIRVQMSKTDKKYSDIIADIKKTKPDLVYTSGLQVTLGIFGSYNAAKQDPDKFITQIAGIFVNVAYPVELGLIYSLQNSGRNISGVGYMAPIDIQLKSLLDYRDYKKIGIIYNTEDEESVINKNQLIAHAQKLGLEVVESKLSMDLHNNPKLDSVPQIINDHVLNNVEILYLGPDSFLRNNIHQYTQMALRDHMPIFSTNEIPILTSKALLGLVANLVSVGKLAGKQAENILHAPNKAENLKFITPSEFSTMLNVKAIRILDDYPTFDQLKRYKIVGYLP